MKIFKKGKNKKTHIAKKKWKQETLPSPTPIKIQW
jgi:hypothetical protein